PRRIREQVRTIDVMPTLLELVGAGTQGLALQGRSLVPLMRGQPDSPRVAFSHARRIDAQQLQDLAASRPDVIARLAGLLEHQARQDAWLRETIGAAPGELRLDEQL